MNKLGRDIGLTHNPHTNPFVFYFNLAQVRIAQDTRKILD
jgi:hypothetical protein